MKCHFYTILLKNACLHLIGVLLYALPSFSYAQAPALQFRHLTNEQGLSNSTIECFFQDSRGFMWIGTRDGLNRYDGYQMKVFHYDPKDSNSISDNYIRYIYEDRQHFLWIATTNGLNRLDVTTNRFTRYKHLPGKTGSISNNIVTAIYEDASNRLWACTAEGGLNVWDAATGSFREFRHSVNDETSISSDNIQCLLEDKKGRFWLGTANGLNLFDRTTGKVTAHFAPDNNARATENKIIRVIHEDKKGLLWIGTEDNGIFVFNPDQKAFTHYQHYEKDPLSLGSNQVRSIITDKEGNTWIGTVNGGLALFDAIHHSFFHYKKETDEPASLSQRTVSALLQDRQGNLWIGTHRGGINIYTPGTEKFTLYRQELRTNSLSYNDVKCFCEDSRGNIWIGTDGGGLNCYNRQTNSFTHFKYSPYNPTGISSNEILHVFEDSESNLWIATWGGGLNLLDRKTGKFTRFLHNAADPTSISSNYIQKIYEDRQHHLWIATYYGGLNLYDRNTKQFSSFINDPKHQTSLSGNNIVSLAEDTTGNLWIGTDDGGLNCYNPVTKRFSHYFHTDDKMPDLRVLFCDSKGRLWTGQTGLYLFDAATNTFNSIRAGGLSTEFIKGMTEDEKGNFWISTSNGLTCYHPETHYLKKYNTSDGLQGLEFEANAYMKTRAGEMFFGGINGFNSFYPGSIISNSFIPPVYLTDFQIFNQRVTPGQNGPLQQDISAARTITLSYRQSSFSLGFAALNYTAPENNQYAYKLDGWDKDWINIGTEHKTSYTNLDPGTYTFHVKAANNDGIWNEQGTSILIVIQPPFWDTWWFKLLVAMVVTGAVVLFYRFKQKLELQKLEERKKEEMHQEQLQFFTNISHEFRTPLSLMLGSLEKIQKDNNGQRSGDYYKIMHRNIQRMTGLINELMDFRKVETGILELKVMPGSLHLFIEEIAEEFCEQAAQKQIHFTVQVPEEMPEAWFDRQVLEKIILNLVSNSFKYTAEGGRIAIELLTEITSLQPGFENELILSNDYKGRQYAYIRVADNGIGISRDGIKHLFERYYKISESHLGSGIGLAFVKSLTALHKGSIRVYSERNMGTEFIICLPVDKNDYKPGEKWVQHYHEAGMRLESIHYRYDQPVSNTEEQPDMDIPTSKSKYHILLADDNEELRQFIKDSLQPAYYVTEATNGYNGLEKAREEQPDLIISDVMMPGMNGIEFCKQVKEDLETSHIPFLMLTARDAPAARLEGISSGADFYFAKPVSIDLLQLTIRNIFDQRRILKDRYSREHFVAAREQVHSTRDKTWLEDLITIIETQLTNPDLDVDYLCSQIGMSRTRLYEKIKGITGQSVSELVRTIRLRKAVHIMTHEDVSLTEVMYRVGIQTQSYFTKAFKKEYGKTPSQFLQELKK